MCRCQATMLISLRALADRQEAAAIEAMAKPAEIQPAFLVERAAELSAEAPSRLLASSNVCCQVRFSRRVLRMPLATQRS